MSILLFLIAIISTITGIIYSNNNMYWVSILFTILAIIFFVYEMIKDTMPEPKQAKTKSEIIVEYSRRKSIPVIDIKLSKTEPSDFNCSVLKRK